MKLGNSPKHAALMVALILAGCKSSADKANDAAVAQAKQQAAATGTAQQVVSTDKDGNSVTTVVQPPAPGQTTQTVTTTRTTRTAAPSASLAPLGQSPSGTSTVNAADATVVSPPTGAGYASDPRGSAATSTVGGGPVITPVDVHVPRGTTLNIRINQHINVKTSHAGERFTGEVVNPVAAPGTDRIAIPKGTPVNGVIDASHRRGHFKGRSILELRLTSMTLNGQSYRLDTHDNVRTKKGKGKRSAAFIGGGTGLGMLVGGLASGGVGLVVGGLAGAGTGTAIGGLTGNRDIDIPAESIINFRLADDLVVQPQ